MSTIVTRQGIHHSIGKERAALFRRYRVVARKQRPDNRERVTDGKLRCDQIFQPDNGR